MTIGQNIRACRKQRGLTQAQLGALCGKTSAAISSYEKGAAIPKRGVMEQIALALEVPLDRLLPGEAPSLPCLEQDSTASDALLYDGILAALKELYGIVEGRVIMDENGRCKRYYVIKQIPDSFVLYEKDIAAIARSAKASMLPLAEYLKKARQSGAEAPEQAVKCG